MPSIAEAPPRFTVSKITQAVKAWIEEGFSQFWVEGEVSGFKHHRPSGHMYFSLKDDAATLPCIFYRGNNLRLKFTPSDGQKVEARGGLSVYESQGKYQLYVEELREVGVGDAELRKRELQEKLRAKGYFDPQYALPFPRYPKLVALVTSGSGAAVRDMLEGLRQRWPLVRVVVKAAKVQGAGAGEDIARSLRMLDTLHRSKSLQVCAVVLGRGGGAREDLAAFDEECVADAIFDCTMPVISAVGHEIDVTIADLVADYRAETPSAAVAWLVPDALETTGELLRMEKRLLDGIRQRIVSGRQTIDQAVRRPALRKPFERIRDNAQRIDELSERMRRAAGRAVDRAKVRIGASAEQLEALSPLGVLSRGYSLTQRDGAIVRRAADVAEGDLLHTRLAEGSVVSRVVGIETNEGDHGR